ncbi:hypothetical protein B5V02_18435 [Mesorhizobium kowhaii]|uniref:Uncharacterized protein n=1 Tax=Mesorhizobium kowhaii TaxID=1300272 RepID=A0A2W7C1S0_9HYPH|nr:hypothetical protein B5V02_18435 [Mesorhizobium kowhaii]
MDWKPGWQIAKKASAMRPHARGALATGADEIRRASTDRAQATRLVRTAEQIALALRGLWGRQRRAFVHGRQVHSAALT